MSKRHLTQHQTQRIQKNQQDRLHKAKHSPELTDTEFHQLGPEEEGLLVAFHGRYAEVEDPQRKNHHCLLRQNIEGLAVGDKVLWRKGPHDLGVLTAKYPHRNLLGRPDKHGSIKPIATNIDQVFIVSATKPKLSSLLIDSYLVAAEKLSIQPILIFNKTDLLTPAEKKSTQVLLDIYKNLGYVVIFSSSVTKEGLHEIEHLLKNKTSIFLGQSGVGKSSLISFFLPKETIATGQLSQWEQGKHTTTTARLYHFPSGGKLIDAPGIREFGLWHMPAEQIAENFIEFREYLGHCKFHNCQHLHEPDCALKQAVHDGKIHHARWGSFQKIISS
ncbi:MAG: small ribosomal subunit biogenesis GTPase RsgA [Proteobacteria bacterium]|nr:small ribosomal subunit biogenesis GTPase RsgA [Pseudomonadota bacterium]